MIDWKAIREEWETNDISFKDLSEKTGQKEATLRSRKNREKWERKISVKKKVTVKAKRQTETKKKKDAKRKEIPVATEDGFQINLSENLKLNDRQQMFCFYYLKNFNAKLAAIRAGYSPDSAHVTGYKLLANKVIAAEISRLKAEMRHGIFIDAMDVLNKYIQIAFADITDFAWFGKKEVDLMGPFGPLIDEKTNEVLRHEINYVDFKDSEYVDGTLITEVKQGKEGIVVKLADKMEALKFLTKHFDMVPDHFKRQLEEEKLKLQYKRLSEEDGTEHYEDSGFNEALGMTAEGVWTDDAAAEARKAGSD